MNQHNRPGLGLFELLGRSWRRPADVGAVAFSPDQASVAFAASDGSVALAPVAEKETPESRIRVSGDLAQMRILPRSKPPMPLSTVTLEVGRLPPIAPYVAGSFLVGAPGGAVRRLSGRGEVGHSVLTAAGPILSLDHRGTADGLTVATDGRHLHVVRGGEVLRTQLDDGDTIGALAISPDGRRVAALSGQGLAIWTLGGAAPTLAVVALPSPAMSLCWNAGSSHVACGLAAGGFSLVGVVRGDTHTVMNFPMPVGSLSWSGAADALVAAGAYRVAAWLQRDGAPGEAIATGQPGLVPVDVVAAHPRRDLVAAAYADGRIVLARLRAADELVIRIAGEPVKALAWSGDGRHLAIGDSDGTAAIVTFPPQIFK